MCESHLAHRNSCSDCARLDRSAAGRTGFALRSVKPRFLLFLAFPRGEIQDVPLPDTFVEFHTIREEGGEGARVATARTSCPRKCWAQADKWNSEHAPPEAKTPPRLNQRGKQRENPPRPQRAAASSTA
jgi:hypothetical protein